MTEKLIFEAPRKAMALLLALTITLGPSALPAFAAGKPAASASSTATPIQHLVVIFNENISFDHYFGAYPYATNPGGEPRFVAAPNTPTVNGLSNALLNANPNLNTANGTGAANPFRLDRSQAVTNDQDHDYTAEQLAFDGGLMDLFPLNTGTAGPPPSGSGVTQTNGLVMGYFDGNTVTAMWNYAQHFALNDNSYGTNFGPSTVGVINLVSGQTNGIAQNFPTTSTASEVADGNGGFTLNSDRDPFGDICSSKSSTVQMATRTVGDIMSSDGITWGSFMGGFNLSLTNPNGSTGCSRSTVSPQILAFALANGDTMAAATAAATV